MLKVKNLNIFYGNKKIIKNLNFHLNHSEILGIVGPSGSGKSTIIWTIMGMIEEMGGKYEGEILFDGSLLTDKPKCDDISIVPQLAMNSFNPVSKVKNSLCELKMFSNLSDDEFEKKLDALLNIVELHKNVLNLYPHQLSGGMKQRLSIVSALSTNPKILILDESTTGLDVLVEAKILYYLKNIKDDLKLSIIFVSHDKRLVDAFCESILEI